MLQLLFLNIAHWVQKWHFYSYQYYCFWKIWILAYNLHLLWFHVVNTHWKHNPAVFIMLGFSKSPLLRGWPVVRGSVTVGTQQGELGEQGISYGELGMGCVRTWTGAGGGTRDTGKGWGRTKHWGTSLLPSAHRACQHRTLLHPLLREQLLESHLHFHLQQCRAFPLPRTVLPIYICVQKSKICPHQNICFPSFLEKKKLRFWHAN